MPNQLLDEWTKGITDNYIDGAPSAAKKLDNLLLNRFKKLVQRPGTKVFNDGAPQLPSGNQKIDSIYFFDSTCFVKSGVNLYYLEDGDSNWTTLFGENGTTTAFPDSELGARLSISEWRGHLFMTPNPGATKIAGCRTIKIYRDGGNNAWRLVQAGLPRAADCVASGINIDNSGSAHYIIFYGLERSYSAKVDGNAVTFQDFGTPMFEFYGGSLPITRAGITWTNTALDNYDTTTGLMDVYEWRTKDAETVPLYTTVKGMGSSLVWGTSPADAALGAAAYFAGGVSFWDPPPLCYYSAIIDGYGFYAAGIAAGDPNFWNTRLWQSHPLNPNGVPSGNFVDIPFKITGLSHVGSYPIVFARRQCYRIEGRFDATGGGSMKAKQISAVMGCIAADAIIRTTEGIFFPSESGWCFTDGFKVISLSEHLNVTYKGLVKDRMVGCLETHGNRLWWSTESATLNPDNTGKNNCAFVLDLNFSTAEDGVFTTASAGANLLMTAMHYDAKNDRILFGDQRGYVMMFDDTKNNDLVVDTTNSAATWNRMGIIWDYVTCAWSFGSPRIFKWMTKVFVIAKNVSGALSVDSWTFNDDQRVGKQLKDIRDRKITDFGMHRVMRWMRSGGLRFLYRQLQFRKGLVILFASDNFALATVNNGAKTVLIASGVWPHDGTFDLRGHLIAFEADGYNAGYTIVNHASTTLTLADAPSSVVGTKWQIRGYPKDEGFELHAIDMKFTQRGEDITDEASGGDGGNA